MNIRINDYRNAIESARSIPDRQMRANAALMLARVGRRYSAEAYEAGLDILRELYPPNLYPQIDSLIRAPVLNPMLNVPSSV